ncbi:MAG: hypothetical protein JWN04_3328 [Myxococcaceae bacterium]|nr:hypothetical protein [Myxococcaceae bacterium]
MRRSFSLATVLLTACLASACAHGPTEADDGSAVNDGPGSATNGNGDRGKHDAGGSGGGKDAAPTDSITNPGDPADGPADPFASRGPNTVSGYANVAPAPGPALDPKSSSTVSPAAPNGWFWYEIDGAVCRDGSPTGFYVHFADSEGLLLYLEGGGACTSPGFCNYNPQNVNQVLAGDGQTLLGSIGGAVPGRQQPGTDGIFNLTNAANPFGHWSMIYVPYCTGDVHFGTRTNVMVPGVDKPQQFVGYRNMEKFIARIAPTFKDKVKRVVLTGASAGGFGTLLNYSLVQDAFGDAARVIGLDDSGPPFPDVDEPVCMQKRWRELWGFADAFPKDCTECMQADGGGLGKYPVFLQKKHPNYTFGIVSSMQDEVIRAFYASGLNDCSGFDTADPAPAVLISFPAAEYTAGLGALRSQYEPSGAFSSYYINGLFSSTYHQHIWRPRFYEAAQGTTTIAQWATDLIAGKMTQVGP